MVSRKDIADQLGVSVSVVSRALNNSGYVEDGKKQRIISLAKELGYNRNPVAIDCAGWTRQVMFFCKDIRNSFYLEMYEGMMAAAREQDYQVVINQDCEFENARIETADGLIFPAEGVTLDYLYHIGKNNYLPFVGAGFGESVQMPRHVPEVRCDLWKGTHVLIDYLREKGHRRIAFASAYPIEGTLGRGMAWKSSMYPTFGVCWPNYYIDASQGAQTYGSGKVLIPTRKHNYLDEDYFENGCIAAEMFHQKHCDATAVVCFNDELATGFLMRIKRLGYRVPEDLSVSGIDGSYIRRYTDSQLTTLDMHPQLVGRRCVEMLLKQIRGGKIKKLTRIPMEIIKGDTVRQL